MKKINDDVRVDNLSFVRELKYPIDTKSVLFLYEQPMYFSIPGSMLKVWHIKAAVEIKVRPRKSCLDHFKVEQELVIRVTD